MVPVKLVMQLLKDWWLLRNENMDQWGFCFFSKIEKASEVQPHCLISLVETCTDRSPSPSPCCHGWQPFLHSRTQNCPLRLDTGCGRGDKPAWNPPWLLPGLFWGIVGVLVDREGGKLQISSATSFCVHWDTEVQGRLWVVAQKK